MISSETGDGGKLALALAARVDNQGFADAAWRTYFNAYAPPGAGAPQNTSFNPN